MESQVTVTARTRARENPKCYRPLYETAARSGGENLLQTTIRNSRAQRGENLLQNTMRKKHTFHLFAKLVRETITCVECGKPHIWESILIRRHALFEQASAKHNCETSEYFFN